MRGATNSNSPVIKTYSHGQGVTVNFTDFSWGAFYVYRYGQVCTVVINVMNILNADYSLKTIATGLPPCIKNDYPPVSTITDAAGASRGTIFVDGSGNCKLNSTGTGGNAWGTLTYITNEGGGRKLSLLRRLFRGRRS